MYLLQNLIIVMLSGLVPAVLFCLLAGRWDLWNVWTTAGIFIAWLMFQSLAIYQKSPAILKERMALGMGGRVRWTVGLTFVLLNMLQWIIAGLDQRFHWSNIVPFASVIAGIVIFCVGWGLFTWAALANPFFSPEVRVQTDRGQQVTSKGPYAIVRHPGYASNVLLVFASALALNSLLSFIPAIIFAVNTVRVTVIEDQMLRDELDGYTAYTAKVRYRLIPGLW